MPIETIVLDLDETLIHSETNPDMMTNPDFIFKIDGIKYFVRKRPGLDLFLLYIIKSFKIIGIWTAATKDYAEKIVNNIFTKDQRKKLKFFMTRKHCLKNKKPLQRIFDSDNNSYECTKYNCIMIDDNPYVLENNPGNAIQIPQFNGQSNDDYLFKLCLLLQSILDMKVNINPDNKIIILKDITD